MAAVHYVAIILAILAIISLLNSLSALRRVEFTRLATHLALSLCFVFLAAFFALGAISLRGFSALTYEQLAARVKIESAGEHQFYAHLTYPNGEQKTFVLKGDQVVIDAHILKWKPVANILGYHTSFELVRIGGRYTQIQNERTKPHTVFPLNDESKFVDIFELRRRFSQLNFLLDTDYGSATFVPAKDNQEYILMVTTSGLMLRRIID